MNKTGHMGKEKIIFLIIVILLGFAPVYSWLVDWDIQIVKPADLPSHYRAGAWVFTVSYENGGAGNYAEIYGPDTMDEEGRLGKVYARLDLPADGDRTSAEVIFDEYTTDVRIRLVKTGGNCRITHVTYHNTDKYTDPLMIYFLWILALGVLFFLFKKCREDSEKLGVLSGLLLIIFVAMLPYMNSFLQKAHDLEFHLLRIEGVYQGLKDGMFPVRINPVQSNGYGYNSPIMYPQLFIYIPAALRLLGLSLMNSYKILVWLSTILSVFTAYYSFKKIFRSPYAAMAGSALYTLGLYRLTNVYCRAAVGEYLAMAFLPLVFYGMYEIVAGDCRKWMAASVGITLMFQQHLLTTEICLGFTLLMCLGCVKRMFREPERIRALCRAALVTVLLNLGTLIPLLQYMKEDLYIFSDGRFLPDMVVYLSEVFATFVKLEGRQELRGTTKGEMPLSIGGILLVFVLLFAAYCYHNREKIAKSRFDTQLRNTGMGCIAAGAVAIWMSMWIFPWTMLERIEIIGTLAKSLQFLSRLLMVPALLFCIVAGIFVTFLIRDYPEKKGIIAFAVLAAAVFSSLYPLESIIQFETYDSKEAVAAVDYTDDLYLYNGDTQEPLREMGKRIWVSEDADVICRNLKRQSGKAEADLEIMEVSDNSYVELPLYYYPQYEVRLNGDKLRVEKGENGVLRARLDSSSRSGKITAYFKTPAVWTAADIVSLLTLVGMAAYLIIVKKSKMGRIPIPKKDEIV